MQAQRTTRFQPWATMDIRQVLRQFGPLSRTRAERLLQRVLRRVAEVNRRPYFLCRVTAVGVFGGYLADAPTIDALDLVVRIAPKPPAPGTSHEVFRPDRGLPYW